MLCVCGNAVCRLTFPCGAVSETFRENLCVEDPSVFLKSSSRAEVMLGNPPETFQM